MYKQQTQKTQQHMSDNGGSPPGNNGLMGLPPLPEGAVLDPRIGKEACTWLDDYVEWSKKWSPRSFEGYHEAVGLALLSTVAARRVRFHFGKERYTNLYLLLVGRTTVWAKTSALGNGRAVLARAGLDFLLAPDQSTPQAFIRSLARTELPKNYEQLDEELRARAKMRLAFGAQRGWFYEEFGSGVEAMMRKDGTMADFRGYLRAFDDCPNRYSRETIRRGVEVVEKPYLSLIGNITPADLRPVASAGSQLWGDGYLARFAFITPPEGKINQGRFPKGERVAPLRLVEPLVDWHKRLGSPQVTLYDDLDEDGEPTGQMRANVGPLPVETLAISDQAFDAWYDYDAGIRHVMRDYAHTDLDGNYGRFGEKALRIAGLFASLAGSDVIALTHLAKAQQIVERWRLYTHRMYEQVTRKDKSTLKEQQDKALSALRRWQGTEKYPDGMTANQVRRFVWGCDTDETCALLDQLVEAGALKKHKPQRATKYFIPNVVREFREEARMENMASENPDEW